MVWIFETRKNLYINIVNKIRKIELERIPGKGRPKRNWADVISRGDMRYCDVNKEMVMDRGYG